MSTEYLKAEIVKASALKAGQIFIPFATELDREVHKGTTPEEHDKAPKLAELPAPIWLALVDGTELPSPDRDNEVTLITLTVGEV